MSRAHSIWICRLADDPAKILNGWTVKREMVDWLNSCGLRLHKLELVRLRDCRPEHTMEVYTVGDVLEGAKKGVKMGLNGPPPRNSQAMIRKAIDKATK